MQTNLYRVIPCPQCGGKVNLTAENLQEFNGNEKYTAWCRCPRGCGLKQVERHEQLAQQLLECGKHSDERETFEKERFLGADCPPLQEKLFLELRSGPLRENEAIELVYEACALNTLSDRQRKHFRDRLRRLQKRLNDLLLKRRAPFQIVRPKAGYLELMETPKSHSRL